MRRIYGNHRSARNQICRPKAGRAGVAYRAAHSIISGADAGWGVLSAALARGARDVAATSAGGAAVRVPDSDGVGTVLLRGEGLAQNRNETERTDWRKVGQRPRRGGGFGPGHRYVAGLDVGADGVGSLDGAGRRGFDPYFAPATSGGDSCLGWRVDQRGNLRRAGFSRIPPAAIPGLYAQPMDCVATASDALRDFARLPRNRSVRENRSLWRSVRTGSAVAQEPAARHVGPCRLGHSQRHLRNLIPG